MITTIRFVCLALPYRFHLPYACEFVRETGLVHLYNRPCAKHPLPKAGSPSCSGSWKKKWGTEMSPVQGPIILELHVQSFLLACWLVDCPQKKTCPLRRKLMKCSRRKGSRSLTLRMASMLCQCRSHMARLVCRCMKRRVERWFVWWFCCFFLRICWRSCLFRIWTRYRRYRSIERLLSPISFTRLSLDFWRSVHR